MKCDGNRLIRQLCRGMVLFAWALMLAGCENEVLQDKGSTQSEESMVSIAPPQSVVKLYPENVSRSDRIKGAIFGYLAGDALGLGTHWYYDLSELQQDYGTWIDYYQDPKQEGSHSFANISRYRYEQGLRAGDVSQTGQLFTLLLESMVETESYDEKNFHERLDNFFETLSGESLSGRYTRIDCKTFNQSAT